MTWQARQLTIPARRPPTAAAMKGPTPFSRHPPLPPSLLLLCLLLCAARLPARAAAASCHMVCNDKVTYACPGFPPEAHTYEPNTKLCFCGTWPNLTFPACQLYHKPIGSLVLIITLSASIGPFLLIPLIWLLCLGWKWAAGAAARCAEKRRQAAQDARAARQVAPI